MQSQQSQHKMHGDNTRSAFDLMHLLVHSHATCFLVFFRSGFGTHALGLNGVVAFLLIPTYAGMAGAPEMTPFFFAWLAALVIQRGKSLSLARRGLIQHSRYGGWPWLAMKIPFVRREVTAKGIVEPAICYVAGACLLAVSPPVGGFVMLGSVSLLVTATIDRQLNRARLRAMRDAQIEHEQLAERFRGLRDDF